MKFDSKEWWEVKFFLRNQSINIIYPNVENVFVVPNQQKKGDYRVNLCYSQFTDEFDSKKWWKVKIKEIIRRIHVYFN